MPGRIRVLVVDDSAFTRQTIRTMLEHDKDIAFVEIATNGIEAMAQTVKLKPDIITLDFEMPEMDGFAFLRWLMKNRPTPVIMVTSFSDSKMVFRALELGAVDFIAKPGRRASPELQNIQHDLLEKVKAICNLKMEKVSRSRDLMDDEPRVVSAPPGRLRKESGAEDEEPSGNETGIVAIGASTGGPTALQLVLTRLPAHFSAPIIISQHMPTGFTRPFAERLNKLSNITVREACDGDLIEAGKAYICPGGHHLTLKKKNSLISVSLKEAAERDKYAPSVDTMMAAAAEYFGSRTTGVVLTGMGNDGALGVVEIKKKGGYTIAEAESTAVIFGMPQEAIRTGSVDSVLPLHEIPKEITALFMEEGEGKWKKNRR